MVKHSGHKNSSFRISGSSYTQSSLEVDTGYIPLKLCWGYNSGDMWKLLSIFRFTIGITIVATLYRDQKFWFNHNLIQ